jgi:hypothetical protein
MSINDHLKYGFRFLREIAGNPNSEYIHRRYRQGGGNYFFYIKMADNSVFLYDTDRAISLEFEAKQPELFGNDQAKHIISVYQEYY